MELYIGWALSIIGMILTVLSFQAKSKVMILIWQTAGSLFYLISYIFLGAEIAVPLNVIYLLRNMLFAFAVKTDRARAATCAGLCAAYAVAFGAYVRWFAPGMTEALWSLLAVIGAFFGTVGAACKSPNAMRKWKLGDSVPWLLYNAHCLSVGGVIGEILNLISICVGLYRFRRQDHE